MIANISAYTNGSLKNMSITPLLLMQIELILPISSVVALHDGNPRMSVLGA